MTDDSDAYGDDSTRGRFALGPGVMVGFYRLEEPLGRGGMGLVWKAWDTASRRAVALKLLPPEFHGNADAIAEVRTAFDLMQAITHHGINKAIAMDEHDQHGPYVVLEFLPGLPLSKFARKVRQPDGTLPLDLVVQLLRPAAQALDYGHGKDILHRDVKPDNILVEDKNGTPGAVWLIDYGLAAEIRATTVTHTNGTADTRGTRPYMAPEQFKGKRHLWDGRTDQYALAVVAYELLAGRRPFDADDEMALMFAIHQEAVEPIAQLSAAVNGVLQRGLAKNKEDRYPTCAAFIDALQAAATAVGWTESSSSTSLPSDQSVPDGGPRKASTHPTKPPPPLMVAPFDAAAAKAGQAAWAEYLGVPVVEKNAAGIELALIPPGEFLMGSSDADVTETKTGVPSYFKRLFPVIAYAAEKMSTSTPLRDARPQHTVRITQPFRLGIYPVTQQQFQQLLRRNPSHFSATGDGHEKVSRIDFLKCPVENVTWFDAIEFCNALSERCGLEPYYALNEGVRKDDCMTAAEVKILGGKGYRLPTEAEWEYACRAGTTTAYWFGNVNNGKEANVDGTGPYGTKTKGASLLRTTVVGSYPANPFGCFDQHGNVWERCDDWYDADVYGSFHGTADDPFSADNDLVVRGGAWNIHAGFARVTYRIRSKPGHRGSYVGFRLARTE